ncbi:MAG: toll/interleukin-1 receptor domain-containing protein [Candidatus Hermodarchaeota archaeon]
MAKKKKKKSNNALSKFKLFLETMTVTKIKELIDYYNETYVINGPKNEKLKGFSAYKKAKLVDFIDSSLTDNEKEDLYRKFEPEIVKSLISDALSLISGEHKVEEIYNASLLPGGKGYRTWFKGKYGSNKAHVELVNDSINKSCTCNLGKIGGICSHQMAIYLMLLSKKTIDLDDFPFEVDKHWFKSIQKRLDLLAAQSLFKEEPAIMFSNGYSIFINGDLVTLKWTGDFPGKKTIDLSEENEDADNWISDKVVDITLKPIKIKTKEGEPNKIIIDSYDIITKIMDQDKLVNKILKKFSKLDNPDLPTDKSSLEDFLRSELKESTAELPIEPPFNAYEGDDSFLFVSYTHKDKSIVYPIIDYLCKNGINIWYDEGIPLSSDWCNTLAEKIVDSNLFLSFISPHVLNSDNTQDEIQFAINEKKTFLAIYLQDTELSPGLKMRMRRIQGLEKFKMDEKIFNTKLLSEIARLINQ